MPSNLFSAGQIGTMTLPNRVIRSATQDPFGPVSYTHLTLPTICSV